MREVFLAQALPIVALIMMFMIIEPIFNAYVTIVRLIWSVSSD